MPVLPVKYSSEPYSRADGHDCFQHEWRVDLCKCDPDAGNKVMLHHKMTRWQMEVWTAVKSTHMPIP